MTCKIVGASKTNWMPKSFQFAEFVIFGCFDECYKLRLCRLCVCVCLRVWASYTSHEFKAKQLQTTTAHSTHFLCECCCCSHLCCTWNIQCSEILQSNFVSFQFLLYEFCVLGEGIFRFHSAFVSFTRFVCGVYCNDYGQRLRCMCKAHNFSANEFSIHIQPNYNCIHCRVASGECAGLGSVPCSCCSWPFLLFFLFCSIICNQLKANKTGRFDLPLQKKINKIARYTKQTVSACMGVRLYGMLWWTNRIYHDVSDLNLYGRRASTFDWWDCAAKSDVIILCSFICRCVVVFVSILSTRLIRIGHRLSYMLCWSNRIYVV